MPDGVDPDVLKRIAELVDGDTWVLADFLADAFSEERYPVSDANNGLYDDLAKYERTALVEHGVEVKASTMRKYRATAIAWPRGARAPRASFKVHARMRGDNRFAEMAQRLKQAEAENRALSATMLQRLREDDGPPRHVDTMQEKLRKRVLAAVKGVLLEGIHPEDKRREDWWNLKRVTDPQLDMAVSELRRLADIIQTRGEVSP
jgi:hypothetical protein